MVKCVPRFSIHLGIVTPLYYGATGVSSGETFTATVTQADGVVSLPGTWSAP